MLKNEIYLFFSKKNLLVLAGAVIAILLIYQFQYMRDYEDYGMEQAQSISAHEEDIYTIVKKYESRIEYYETYEPESENLSELKKMHGIWQAFQPQKRMIKDMWENWSPDKDCTEVEASIRQMTEQIDQTLVKGADSPIDLGDDILYDETRREWSERMVLHDAYREAGREEPVNKVTPTGAYVVLDALGGDGTVFLVLIIALILWNYDIWSADFDESTYKLIYTLPCSRGKICGVRCFARCGLSILCTAVLLLVLFFRGMVSFGTGLGDFQVVNRNALRWGFFSFIDNNLTETGDVAVSAGTAIGMQFLLVVLYLVLFLGITQLLSFALKNSTSVVCVLAVCVTIVSTIKQLPTVDEYGDVPTILERLNPVSYSRVTELLHGDFGVGVLGVAAEELGLIAILFIATRIWMTHREM